MASNFIPQINELQKEPDSIEKLRDYIAALLKAETQNQYKIAIKEELPDAADYNFRVFIENARPYDTEGDPILEPLINIMLQKSVPTDGNARIGPQKQKAIFIIDCITFGNDGEAWNDKSAAARAWKTARIIRRILMSEQYAYLGLRGMVGSRNIVSIETGVPENGGDSLTAVTARITLEVQYVDGFVNEPGAPLEAIYFTVYVNGEVIIDDD